MPLFLRALSQCCRASYAHIPVPLSSQSICLSLSPSLSDYIASSPPLPLISQREGTAAARGSALRVPCRALREVGTGGARLETNGRRAAGVPARVLGAGGPAARGSDSDSPDWRPPPAGCRLRSPLGLFSPPPGREKSVCARLPPAPT